MSVTQQPYYRLKPRDLADWLSRQGDEAWWSVDGEPTLAERLSFPCPSNELAAALRESSRVLILLNPEIPPRSDGEAVGADRLDDLARKEGEDRVFLLQWEDGVPDSAWILAEDKEISATASAGPEEGE